MENNLYIPIPRLFTLGEDVVNGLELHAATAGITRNTKEVVETDLEAAKLASAIYEAGAQLLRDKNAELRGFTSDARQFIRLARDVMIPTLGSRYSAAWNQTGLVGSLAIPSKRTVIQGVSLSIGTFLTNNPGLEVVDKVTAVIAGQHHDAISNGRTAVQTQKTAVKNLKLARDEKVALLVRRLQLFITELEEEVGSEDPIWLSFGLNIPGIKKRPEMPTNLTVVLIGNNALSVKWDKAPRASYYRVWRRIVGVDPTPVIAGSPADLDFLMESLPSNATVEIALSALNNGGESPRTEVVTVQML